MTGLLGAVDAAIVNGGTTPKRAKHDTLVSFKNIWSDDDIGKPVSSSSVAKITLLAAAKREERMKLELI